jgi:hypothetical protein
MTLEFDPQTGGDSTKVQQPHAQKLSHEGNKQHNRASAAQAAIKGDQQVGQGGPAKGQVPTGDKHGGPPCGPPERQAAMPAKPSHHTGSHPLDVTRIKGDLELASSGNFSAQERAEKEIRDLTPDQLHKVIGALNNYYGPYRYGMPHIAVKTDCYGNVLELDFVPAKASTQHDVHIYTSKSQQNEFTVTKSKPQPLA